MEEDLYDDDEPQPAPSGRLGFERHIIDDYEIGNIIGQGAFGLITRVTERRTGNIFAMKECNKQYLTEHDAAHFVLRERRALSRVNHRFIIKLHRAFQDANCVYFVLDYMRNGSLRNLMQKFHRMSNDLVRFYAAEIILGLEYLQSVQIVHRDIKGENILMDDNHHIKIADFGTCAVIADRQAYSRGAPVENNSLVGTACYMAPEIATKSPVTYGSDLWSMACLLYEMHTGHYCFDTHPPESLAHRICNVQHTPYPKNAEPQLRDLISKILVPNPADRLGVSEHHRRMTGLKQHPFFMNVNFENIHRMMPPIPNPKARRAVPPPPDGSVAFVDFDYNSNDRGPRNSPPLPPRPRFRASSKSCTCRQATGSACICHLLPNYGQFDTPY